LELELLDDPALLDDPPPELLVDDVSAPEELPTLNFPSGMLSGAPAAQATKASAPERGTSLATDPR
jgi:hypothetical protein